MGHGIETLDGISNSIYEGGIDVSFRVESKKTSFKISSI